MLKYPRKVEGKEWLMSVVWAFYPIYEAPYFPTRAVIPLGEVHIPTIEHFKDIYGEDLVEVNRDICIIHELIHLKLGYLEKILHGREFQILLKHALEEYSKKRTPPLNEAEKREVRKHLQFYITQGAQRVLDTS